MSQYSAPPPIGGYAGASLATCWCCPITSAAIAPSASRAARIGCRCRVI